VGAAVDEDVDVELAPLDGEAREAGDREHVARRNEADPEGPDRQDQLVDVAGALVVQLAPGNRNLVADRPAQTSRGRSQCTGPGEFCQAAGGRGTRGRSRAPCRGCGDRR
jgi:hypothetical protein